MYRAFIKYCFFIQIIFDILPPLPRQDWAAIGCTENGQPIRLYTLISDLR